MRKILYIFLLIIVRQIMAQDGIVKTYYENENIESAVSYADGILVGTSYWYFPNGNIEKEITYSDGKVNGWMRVYYESGLPKEERHVVKGVRDGLTKYYYENGGLKEVRSYEGGILIHRTEIEYDASFVPPVDLFNAGNRQLESQEKEEFICDADLCPEPIGGMEKIYEKLVYPEHAKLYELEGVVKLIAAVNESGIVTNTEIIEGLGLGCEDAAVDAVKKTRFLPGRKDGQRVVSNIILTIEFKLDNKPKAVAVLPEKYSSEESGIIKRIDRKPETAVKNVIQEKIIAEKNEPIEIAETSESPKPQSVKGYDCELDECPHPVGGMAALMKNFRMPSRAEKNNAEGEVVIVATVDKNGYVRDTKVLQEPGYGCGVAAEVAVLDTKFFPGKLNGVPTRSELKLVIPIHSR